jgi:hypothetical protein
LAKEAAKEIIDKGKSATANPTHHKIMIKIDHSRSSINFFAHVVQ